MKKLALLLLLFIFFIGCGSNEAGSLNVLKDYWDAHGSITELVAQMKADGFVYGNNIDDIAYVTDMAIQPEVLFVTKVGNCYSYANFYKDFLRYRNISYQMWLLRRGYEWHYIVYVDTLCLSNVSSSYKTLDEWYAEGWHYQQKVNQ